MSGLERFELGADAASILSLVITIAVWWQVRSIKRSFVQRTRLPELDKQLRQISRDLLEKLREDARLSQEIARLHAMMANLLDKVDNPQRGAVKRIMELCDQSAFTQTARFQLSRERAWEVYDEVQWLIESLDQTARDFKSRP